ncbi:MAG: 3-hydroxybutyryl-CoA dehydrogenase [Flavobacteriales bacterium]|nr:3-hydroxybutyryl-CoA dehydrogenase [Flavobacteriales bacterium]
MKIGVIGSGAMGSGIAQLAATASHETLIFDNNSVALRRSAEKTAEGLQARVDKGKISREEAERILNNITYVSNLPSFSSCNLIIEAIVEDLEVKKTLFKELEMIIEEECILATNTSSLSVTSIASSCRNASRVLGIHFFNPAIVMPLVELVPALQTSNNTMQIAKEIISGMGKTVVIAKDTPGFIVNRVARPFYGEAFKIFEEGIAGKETIDWASRTIGGFRMGPFELTDFIGHDVNYAVTESVWTSFYYDNRFKPSLIQKQLVDAGYLGRKSGRGFYNYMDPIETRVVSEDHELGSQIVNRILVMLFSEAADALYMKICSEEDLEKSMTKGVNYPKGLLAWANEFGISRIVRMLDDLYERYHDSRYRCCPLLRDMDRNKEIFKVSKN